MKVDIVSDLGYLTLGTRLKRLAERLQSQAQAVLDEAGIGIPAAYHPVLAALDRLGPLNVGELAEVLGISQPAVSRTVEHLIGDGLVGSRTVRQDRRQRPIALSKTGSQLVAQAKRTAWPRIESAVKDACIGVSGSLLTHLSALETALSEAPLRARPADNSRKKRHA